MIEIWKASWVGSKRVNKQNSDYWDPCCILYIIPFTSSYTCFFSGRRNIQELKTQISLPFEGFTEAHKKEGISKNLVSSYRKTCNKTKHPFGIGAELSQGRGQKQHLFEIGTSDDRLPSCACGIHLLLERMGRYLASEISLMSIPQKCCFPCFNMFRWLWTTKIGMTSYFRSFTVGARGHHICESVRKEIQIASSKGVCLPFPLREFLVGEWGFTANLLNGAAVKYVCNTHVYVRNRPKT